MDAGPRFYKARATDRSSFPWKLFDPLCPRAGSAVERPWAKPQPPLPLSYGHSCRIGGRSCRKSREEALEAETRAIREEFPRFNNVYNGRRHPAQELSVAAKGKMHFGSLSRIKTAPAWRSVGGGAGGKAGAALSEQSQSIS